MSKRSTLSGSGSGSGTRSSLSSRAATSEADIPPAGNKSANLRAKAAADKAAITVADKKEKEAELAANKAEKLARAKEIIAQRKAEAEQNAKPKAKVSAASGKLNWKAQSVVATAVKEGAELAKSLKPIDAGGVNVSAPKATKALELRKSVGNTKAAKTKAESDVENTRGKQLQEERMAKAKQIIAARKEEHQQNKAVKPEISKAAPTKWTSKSVVATAVKEGAELAKSLKPIDAGSVDVTAPKATKALELRKSVGNAKAAKTKAESESEAKRGSALRAEDMAKAKAIIASRKEEAEQNKVVKPEVSKPTGRLSWKAESVVAKAVAEGEELAQSIRPIRPSSKPNSRRSTLELTKDSTSRRASARTTATGKFTMPTVNETAAAAQPSTAAPVVPQTIRASATPTKSASKQASRATTPSSKQNGDSENNPHAANGVDSKHSEEKVNDLADDVSSIKLNGTEEHKEEAVEV